MSRLIQGDCLEVMKAMPTNSVDSIVSDPPYGISFMSKLWDYDVPKVEVWQEAMRVLKPGGHALIACGTRTQHRMAVNIEDAGFEIRDIVAYVYGSGFPKSLNIGKAVDKLQENEKESVGRNPNSRENCDKTNTLYESGTVGKTDTITKGNSPYEGWGTALKPAMELWTLCRKPLEEKTVASNTLKYGTGGINIDGCRVEGKPRKTGTKPTSDEPTGSGSSLQGSSKNRQAEYDEKNEGRFPANLIHDGSEEVVSKFPDDKSRFFKQCPYELGEGNSIKYTAKASKSERNKGTNNYIIINICVENTALVQLPEKVISERTELWFTELFGKQKMEKYQMDFKFTTKTETKKTTISLTLSCSHHLNIKEFIQDVLKMRMENGGNPVVSVENTSEWKQTIIKELTEYLLGVNNAVLPTQLKISVNEGNFHSTVKPIALMKYLCRLITPKGGTILDCFMGSGSTGVGAKAEGFNFIGIELDEEYCKIAQARIGDIEIEKFDSNITEVPKELPITNSGKTTDNIITKCPSCGGKLKKTKYGKTCEDCLTDF